MTSPLSSSVLSTHPESALIAKKTELQDGQIVDKSMTSYKDHPEVHAVQIRKSDKGNLYEYPIFIKGTKSAQEWKSQLQEAAKTKQEVATINGLSYSTKGVTAIPTSKNYAPASFVGQPKPLQIPSGLKQHIAPNQEIGASSSTPEEETSFAEDQHQMMIDGALLLGNAASIGASFIPGAGNVASAGIGYATDLGQFGSDLQDGLQPSDVSGLALNMGLSTAGLIPGGGLVKGGKFAVKAAKMATTFVKYAKVGMYGQGAMQVATQIGPAIEDVKNNPGSPEKWNHVMSLLKDAMHFVRAAHGMRKAGLTKPAAKPAPVSGTRQSNINQKFEYAVKQKPFTSRQTEINTQFPNTSR